MKNSGYHAAAASAAPLSSRHFVELEIRRRDIETLRRDCWQLVASASQLPRIGDTLGCECLGVPVLVRRETEGFIALHNACAHRQCLIAANGIANTAEIRCPYHGWRYQPDGRTAAIPGAAMFRGLDKSAFQVRAFAVRQIGDLLLVHLNRTPGEDWQTDELFDEFAERTSEDRWRLTLRRDLNFDCDWKIPVEASLESYHLDEVHAGTFGADPGESATDHEFLAIGTRFRTALRGDGWIPRLEAATGRAILGEFDQVYRHTHRFPNLLASWTDLFGIVMQVVPLRAESPRCQIRVFGFTRRAVRWGLAGRITAANLGRIAGAMALRVLAEDAALFPRIQAGMTGSDRPRVFGRCEERLSAFENHWTGALNKSN